MFQLLKYTHGFKTFADTKVYGYNLVKNVRAHPVIKKTTGDM